MMMKDEIPNSFNEFLLTFNQFHVKYTIYMKKAQNIPIFDLKFRQTGDFLGTRIVRVLSRNYSRFE